MRIQSGLVFATVILGACGAPTTEDVSAAGSSVQSSYADGGVTGVSRAYEILRAESADLQTKASAASHSYHFGEQRWSTCGLTFISPHYAITAGHCTAWWYENTATMGVEQYDTTTLQTSTIVAQEQVTGSTLSTFAHPDLTTAQGYVKSTYLCDIVANCAEPGGGNCPTNVAQAIMNNQSTNDVSIVYCRDRAATATWTSAASPSTLTGVSVEVRWFHEVVNMPTLESTSPRWVNYGAVVGAKTQNWHYAGYHSLLPLRSSSIFYNNTKYYYGIDGAPLVQGQRLLQTNIPACHGMSGSGLFPNSQSGTNGSSAYVMGIADASASGIQYTDTAGRAQLCGSMEQWRPTSPQQVNSRFIVPAVVEELGKVNYIVSDRQ